MLFVPRTFTIAIEYKKNINVICATASRQYLFHLSLFFFSLIIITMYVIVYHCLSYFIFREFRVVRIFCRICAIVTSIIIIQFHSSKSSFHMVTTHSHTHIDIYNYFHSSYIWGFKLYFVRLSCFIIRAIVAFPSRNRVIVVRTCSY